MILFITKIQNVFLIKKYELFIINYTNFHISLTMVLFYKYSLLGFDPTYIPLVTIVYCVACLVTVLYVRNPSGDWMQPVR